MKFPSLVLLIIAVMALPLSGAAQVPRVIPQESGPDGGLVHIVQYGDTLDGILNAYINYGVTLDQLLTLNGWRFKPQFIYVDDPIIILPPGSTTPGNGLPVPVEAAPPPPTAVPEGQVSTDSSSAAPAPPAAVKTAADIQSLSAMEVVAPFVPVLGEAPPPPAAEAPATPEQAVEEVATEAGAIALIPTNTLLPENPAPAQPAATEVPVQTDEAVIVPTVEVPTTIPQPTPQTEVAAVEPDASMPDYTQTLGRICASFYDDINENGRRDADEVPLAGGLILIGEGASATSDDSGSACLVDLGAGSQSIQAAAPDGYGITSPDALRVLVTSGQTANVSFGASLGYEAPESLPAIEETLSVPVPEVFRTASAAAQADSDESPLDQLFAVSGLIVLALGLLIFSGGILLALWLRLVRS